MSSPKKIELLAATRNKKKLKEIKEILKDLDLEIISLADLPRSPRIVENGRTFKDNAIKKAVRTAGFTGKLTLGEDSGLCVEALNGKPGVYSSRFSGKAKSDLKNNLKILRLLQGVPLEKRKACYVSSVALADKNGLLGVKVGTCFGLIGFKMRGSLGFGYDPIFIIPKYNRTFAELGSRIKHKMSHRYRALLKLRTLLIRYLK